MLTKFWFLTHLSVKLTICLICWPSIFRKSLAHFTHLTWNECCVSKGSIGFPKKIFGSSNEVIQIRIMVRQMMYVDQFEVFSCTNRSITAAQRSQTSWFNVGFSSRNSEPTVKQPKEVFSKKHRAHCLKARPGYWGKIAKHCKQILLPEIVKVFTRTWKESNVAGAFQSISSRSLTRADKSGSGNIEISLGYRRRGRVLSSLGSYKTDNPK